MIWRPAPSSPGFWWPQLWQVWGGSSQRCHCVPRAGGQHDSETGIWLLVKASWGRRPRVPTHAPREGAEPAPPHATAPGVTGNGMDAGSDARRLHAEHGISKTGYGYALKGVFETKSLSVQ